MKRSKVVNRKKGKTKNSDRPKIPKRPKRPKRSNRPKRSKRKNTGSKGALGWNWWRNKTPQKPRVIKRKLPVNIPNKLKYKTYDEYEKKYKEKEREYDRDYNEWLNRNRDEIDEQGGDISKVLEPPPPEQSDILTKKQFDVLDEWFTSHNKKNKLLNMTSSKYDKHISSKSGSKSRSRSKSRSNMSRVYNSKPSKRMDPDIKFDILTTISGVNNDRLIEFFDTGF